MLANLLGWQYSVARAKIHNQVAIDIGIKFKREIEKRNCRNVNIQKVYILHTAVNEIVIKFYSISKNTVQLKMGQRIGFIYC